MGKNKIMTDLELAEHSNLEANLGTRSTMAVGMGGAGMGSPLQDSDSKPMEISQVMGDSVTNTLMTPTCEINGVNASLNGADSSKAKKKLDYTTFNVGMSLKIDFNGNSSDSSMGKKQSKSLFPS